MTFEVAEKELSDPLSIVTRRERTYLLLTNFALAAVVWGSLVPTKIEALGLTLARANVIALVFLLFGAELYLLLAFWIYARADLTSWRLCRSSFLEKSVAQFREEALREPPPINPAERNWDDWVAVGVRERIKAETADFDARMKFEYYFPLVVGIITPVLCAARVIFWPFP